MHFFFKVNIDIFLRNACVITVFTFIPYISAAMGDMILAVNSLLLQLFMLFSYIMDGFAYAGEALTGRFIGAKDNYFLRKTIHNLLKWGALLAFLFTIIYFFWGEDILYLLTNNEHIVAASSNYLIWTILIPIAGFAAFIFDGIYVGATASKAMRNIVMIATTIFFLVFYLSKEAIGNNGIWIALLIFLVTRSALMWIFNTKFIVLRED
jgi:MATE family multidrug resistance protein